MTEKGELGILTFTALKGRRNCPMMGHLRLDRGQVPIRQFEPAMFFGSTFHSALETWHRGETDPAKQVFQVLDGIDKDFAVGEPFDLDKHKREHLMARAMMLGYARRYPEEKWDIATDRDGTPMLEWVFEGSIDNPETTGTSRTFKMMGKVDGVIVDEKGDWYLLEHKTAATIDDNYLKGLWCDSQIAIYVYYLRKLGYPIVGVYYNICAKTSIRPKKGETEAEYQARYEELCATNKSGTSKATRSMPETEEEFIARLNEFYDDPNSFHREMITLSQSRLDMVPSEIWDLTQSYLICRRTDKWPINTDQCQNKYHRWCVYYDYCSGGFDEAVLENHFEYKAPHQELGLGQDEEEEIPY